MRDEVDFSEAIESFNEAIKINLKNADYWNKKGTALDKLGMFQEAVKCYDKSKEIFHQNNK